MSDAINAEERHFLTIGSGRDAREIAMILRPAAGGGDGPSLVWLSGYRSDMSGTKAVELDGLAARLGLASIRFDYSGHGLSGGEFTDGTISRWLEEALAVIDHAAPRRAVLVGSSMGGWIALRLAQELARRGTGPDLDGMVLIAPAPDFTSELIEPHLSEADKASLSSRGYFEELSEYSPEPNIYTRVLIEDGRENRVLTGIIETNCPVHILQGMEDRDVPYRHALRLMEHLPADDAVLTMVRDGDHRLSRPEDIERMLAAVSALVAKAE
ncbi:alpha/beta hydrolase [Rhizobiaceae bacterium n13]|uniref:Palmitoyl-protein thioesterase ABHD10, mitochondrial n=1 Tax=Ferirhizobium litorale TaxID=2927786 RepID=A0AAE3QKC2_9HYPH|nr:alpha/beta hydrolase [Fererhizobium litorale]MDI7864538.1 alpha/beta hydrolase [Fererhizobium litorale]MDI7924921.1 alpha/beta hydrolase [Fererhizobium litorale]